ncbi:MAG TPA: TetR/AcrR family transcriptional regulator [Bacteroidia bacterium]|nr:TetR/AcrR family transcriptional regulator [Bacteroidia bacterium]
MTKNKLNTEERIFNSACEVFLLYGYHGTTIRKITELSGANNSALNYYFRSKDKLYEKVVGYLLGTIPNAVDENEKLRWFLFTELYNNHQLFEKTIRNLNPNKYDNQLEKIKKLVGIQ